MLPIGTLALVLALELGIVGWPASSLRRLLRPGWSEALDLAMLAVFVLGAAQLATAICSLGASVLIQRAAAHILLWLPHLHPGPVLGFALYIVAIDFCQYWFHRAYHSRWLWHLHKVHHSAQQTNPLTPLRNNPAILAFEPLAALVPLALIGANPTALLIFGIVWGFDASLIHAQLPWTYGRAGQWLISPRAHAVHHSQAPEHRDKNFGVIFSVWDRMFGTWRHELASP